MSLRTGQSHPWAHVETGWQPERIGEIETLLTLSNGFLGIRGVVDEGLPAWNPSTYINGLFEFVPALVEDRGFGDPDFDQVLVSAPDGTRISLEIDGCMVGYAHGETMHHEQVLDVREGILARKLKWRSPSGVEAEIRSRRIVSLEERNVGLIEFEVEVDRRVDIALQTELALRSGLRQPSLDPRKRRPLDAPPLQGISHEADIIGAAFVHRTHHSGLAVISAVDHALSAGREFTQSTKSDQGATWLIETVLEPGTPLTITKSLYYSVTDDTAAVAHLRDARFAARANLERGFESVARAQQATLAAKRDRTDIVIEGDPELQHALRYAQFQLHQNTALAHGCGIPAKGLTGDGYGGHAFWDTEMFVLPMLRQCDPSHVESALGWRLKTKPKANARAARLGYRGAVFPWRTINGDECSTYIPAGTAAFHVNGAIALEAQRHIESTQDLDFARHIAAPLMIDVARLWLSLGRFDESGAHFVIDGVTGPDEYSPLVNNNLYTNLLARENLRAAAAIVTSLDPSDNAAHGVTCEEMEEWEDAAARMLIPFDDARGVHLQHDAFAGQAPFDFARVDASKYPLFLHVPYFELYRTQVIKQPDVVLAMALFPREFTEEEIAHNFAFYERLTVRDSSLSAGTLAIVAALTGETELAYDYLAEAALLDHYDESNNTADGLHLAALAGGWSAAVNGLAGARETKSGLSFRPRLPNALSKLAFNYSFRGNRISIEVEARAATYALRSGDHLAISHWGQEIQLSAGSVQRAEIPTNTRTPLLIEHPPARAPRRRRPHVNSGGENHPASTCSPRT